MVIIQRISVGLDPRLSFAFAGFFFFFFLAARISERTKFTIHVLFNTIHALFRYCSWDLQSLYSKKNKN